MLTSAKNKRIQYIRKLQSSNRFRKENNVLVIEGVRLIEESYKAGWLPDLVLFTNEVGERGKQVLNSLSEEGIKPVPVSEQVMQAASDTHSPQGILAVIPIKNLPIPQNIDFLLMIDKVRDPGNLGTILRTAQATDVDMVVITPGTVDPYNPKVLRSGMGAHFNVPIIQCNWREVSDLLEVHQLQVYLADSSEGQPHYDMDFKSPTAIIIGGEAEGASSEAENIAKFHIHIPMAGKIDSLNSAVAAALLMFEVIRQRI